MFVLIPAGMYSVVCTVDRIHAYIHIYILYCVCIDGVKLLYDKFIEVGSR